MAIITNIIYINGCSNNENNINSRNLQSKITFVGNGHSIYLYDLLHNFANSFYKETCNQVYFMDRDSNEEVVDEIIHSKECNNSHNILFAFESMANFLKVKVPEPELELIENNTIPFVKSFETMLWNMDMLNKYKLSIPNKIVDFEKTLSIIKKGEGRIPFEIDFGASSFAAWVFTFGGHVEKNGLYNFHNKGAIDAMVYLNKLVSIGLIKKIDKKFQNNIQFRQGLLVATCTSSASIPSIIESDDFINFKIKTSPLPFISSVKNPILNVYERNLYYIKNQLDKNKIVSTDFIKYIKSSKSINKIFRKTYYLIEVDKELILENDMGTDITVEEKLDLKIDTTKLDDIQLSIIKTFSKCLHNTEPTFSNYNIVRPIIKGVFDIFLRKKMCQSQIETELKLLTKACNSSL